MPFNLRRLEREQAAVVESSACTELLCEVRKVLPRSPFGDFRSWADIRRWLDCGGVWREETDQVLRPLLHTHQCSSERAWHDILLFLFWRPLMRIYGRTRTLDPESDHRFSLVYWCFSHALQRLDLERRCRRIGSKILQDVWHDVRENYKRERARSRPLDGMLDEIWVENEESHDSVRCLGVEDSNYHLIEFQHDRSWAIARLKDLVRAERLSRTDCLILIGCHLYGRTLDEMADRMGLSYQAAKKRRQRAADLLQKVAPELSPDLSDTPLMSLRRAPRKEKFHGDDL